MKVLRFAFTTIAVVLTTGLVANDAYADQVTVTLTAPANNSAFARNFVGKVFTVSGVATASALVANGATARVHVVVKNTNSGQMVDTDLGSITLQQLTGVNYSFDVSNPALPTGAAGDTYTVQVNVQGATFGGQSPIKTGITFTPK